MLQPLSSIVKTAIASITLALLTIPGGTVYADGHLDVWISNRDVWLVSDDDADKDIDVTFALVNGDHHIHVTTDGSTEVSVFGDYQTSYSYGADVTSIVVDDFIDDVFVRLGDGDDSLVFRGFTEYGSNGDIQIETGWGNNHIWMESILCRYLVVQGRNEHDEIFLVNTSSLRTRIETLGGDDEVELYSVSSTDGAVIDTGSGRDYVHLYRGSALNAVFEIYTRTGNDEVIARNFGGYGAGLLIETFTGNDEVKLLSGEVRHAMNPNTLDGFKMS